MALWAAVGLVALAIFNVTRNVQQQTPPNVLSYSDFLVVVEDRLICDATIKGSTVSGRFCDMRNFSTYIPNNTNVVQLLTEKGVRITAEPDDKDTSTLFSVLISWFPMLLLIGVWIFFMNRQNSGGGGGDHSCWRRHSHGGVPAPVLAAHRL